MAVITSAQQSVEIYTKGTKAWFEDKREAWVSATCLSNTVNDQSVRLVFQSDNEDEKEYVFEATWADIEKTAGSKLPPLRNPPKMEATDDLTNLSYLNEPAVMNTIRTRYLQHLIYTYSGIVLIAMNPFDRLALYDPDIVQQYSGRRRGELEPHLFAIAEDAYRCMIREKTNQTIVVSGESGAGKTVSAKYIMRYFAMADDQDTKARKKKSDGGMTEVEEQILATNPIMEAFGNAKTTRNDNSSRFGKYIEIQFDNGANIIGAKIRTYLLERSRLIFQPETERNYHIFYQLCAGAPSSEKRELGLGDFSNFHYLNQSGTGTVLGMDDAAEFEVTQRALSTIGVSVQLQWKIFRLLAALLHLGDIQVTGRGDAMLSESDPALLTATRLLGIDHNEFRKWIIRKQIITRNEKIVTNLSPTQAAVVKDSVAKYIYANLFDWLVNIINDSLSCPDDSNVCNFIGVLDIYGFEHFKKNSFEQFCINYANEKLQQQFNQHVFKLEQEEYIQEKINWTFIEFSDNQKCIELIEAKMGVLSLLDEESRLPSGTDQGFIQKLYSNFDNAAFRKVFKKPRFSNTAFTIAHYAHDVEYEAENFLDKNKDTVPDEHLTLLQTSEFDYLKEIMEKAALNQPVPTPEASKRLSMTSRKPTLGSIFKLSLINLMDTIGNTNVHYIRCIKPNEAKVAWEFDPNMVLSQLRACGVLETIRISCAGYPSRWSYEEFADRYYALVSSKHWDPRMKPEVEKLCFIILETSIKDVSMYQAGISKIFFRAGQLAYLEKLRTDRFNECAVLLQKNIRRFVYRTRYVRMQELAVKLQCIARRRVACANMLSLLENRAALTIQKNWRRVVERRKYLAIQAFIFKLQAVSRAYNGRRQFELLRENHAAVQIQRLVRGWFARKHYKKQISMVVHLQSCIRRRVAHKELKAMITEARSVVHFKEVSYALENKVVELTQTLTAVRDERKAALDRSLQLEGQVKNWSDRYEKMERKAKGFEERLQEPTVPQAQWNTLQSEKDSLATDYKKAMDKIKSQDKELSQMLEQIAAQKENVTELQKSLEEANERANKPSNEAEIAELKSQIAALKTQLGQALNMSRKPQPQPQPSASTSRGLSPAPRSIRNLSPSPASFLDTDSLKEPIHKRSISPATIAMPRRSRRNSSTDVVKTRPKTSIDAIRQTDVLSSNKTPRPTSVDHLINILGGKSVTGENGESPEDEIHSILRDEDSLQEEIHEGLIKALKMPLPSLQNPPSQKEIFFPAHMISMCVTEMWRLKYVQESERLMFTVMDTIQKQCLSFTGDDAVVPCAFWLTNVHELLSLLCQTLEEMEQGMFQGNVNGRRSAAWQDFEKLVRSVKYEMQCLEDNIFHAWMKELKKRLSKMVVPAIIEGQSLPGFITSDSGRFFNKLLTGSSQPTYNMDELLNFLNKVWPMQIQYNTTRIEEWCKGHDISEGTLQLEHLIQTTKLLQFKKACASLEDIENIYDVCWILSPTQIQKLISQYHVADYENPIRPDILKVVASHVVSGDKSDVLLLDSVAIDDTTNPFEIPGPRETRSQKYLPAWVSVFSLSLSLKCFMFVLVTYVLCF
ncbi:P-loop containing nucleoside triphosphate hydrolase protein [Spinellus fusiger]|nr:P-loop containing nucleoside triphosphate hydrolase protein [Spinellus fusiger]